MAHVENHRASKIWRLVIELAKTCARRGTTRRSGFGVYGHTVSAVSTMTSFVPRWIKGLAGRGTTRGEAARCSATCAAIRGSPLSRVARTKTVVHVADLAAEAAHHADDPRFGA